MKKLAPRLQKIKTIDERNRVAKAIALEIESSLSQLCLRIGIFVIVTWLLIPLTFLIPLIDSTTAPYFDLTQPFSLLAYWLSYSGSVSGAPFVVLLMLMLLVTRAGITAQRCWKEGSIIVLIAALFAGEGAWFNEHIVKPQLKLPRPNIVWLAGENGSGLLGMTAADFPLVCILFNVYRHLLFIAGKHSFRICGVAYCPIAYC
ncbi:MAG: hypothetical protein COA83_09145 [Methylophaga sp.]|nr:MAG: hypothetical protein COA83_09145 [Methylophaga sp.]